MAPLVLSNYNLTLVHLFRKSPSSLRTTVLKKAGSELILPLLFVSFGNRQLRGQAVIEE